MMSGSKESQLTVVPIGLEDWDKLDCRAPEALPQNSLRILFVGRLEERKGIDVFLEAVKQVLPEYSEVYVDIVGNDELIGKANRTYRELFESDSAADAIRDRVRFHREVSDVALRGLYRACDIFVAPSRFELFGLILLEAMMFAKPVIGCRAGGMVEVVEHGEFGLLAEPGIFRFVDAAFAAADCGRWSASSSRFGRRRLTTSGCSRPNAWSRVCWHPFEGLSVKQALYERVRLRRTTDDRRFFGCILRMAASVIVSTV